MLMKQGEAVAAFSLLQPATVPTALWSNFQNHYPVNWGRVRARGSDNLSAGAFCFIQKEMFSEELLSNCWQPFPSVECSFPQTVSADAIGLGKKEQEPLRKDILLWDHLLCGSLITEMCLVQRELHTQQREGQRWRSMGNRHSCSQGSNPFPDPSLGCYSISLAKLLKALSFLSLCINSFSPNSSLVCAAGILIWRVLFVTSVRDTRGVDLLSFNLSLNEQQIISLEQVGQWRGGACSGLGKKILKMFFINVLHSFENKPPQCDWIKVNMKQHIKRLCTNTLVCLEMRLPGQFKRGLGSELVIPWPWGAAHCLHRAVGTLCHGSDDWWAFRGVSLNHTELASPSGLESQLGF
ncbi:hypothetical protein EK904_001802 [Melospiza melodia maxima]|nr:hypothetical protein EK904_001802 [Melospiza melodia maxima]